MPTYAIGDVQGCLQPLKQLLKKINYSPNNDVLWFTGDLINRGPQSLETLRFVKELPTSTICVLGNHDLTLLAAHYGAIEPTAEDNYQTILRAKEKHALIEWLQQQPLIHFDEPLNTVLVHAGIYPLWNCQQAIKYAQQAQASLKNNPALFFEHLFGNEPSLWDEAMNQIDKQRFIVNAFTRMRYCYSDGTLIFNEKGAISASNSQLIPWFALPKRKTINAQIIFGHWASLQQRVPATNLIALDSGCVWGNALTAFCLETKTFYSVKCPSKSSS